MRKVLIFGNSGSGKSTLARALCESEGLSHLDLDTLAWRATDPPQRVPVTESSAAIREFINASSAWVIEGCYADLLEQALPFCNEIIFMDLPISACIANARQRPWEPHKYESKQAQDANLEMLLDWISQYEQREDTFSRRSHLALYESFGGKKTILNDNASALVNTP
jgi:adenylate kinase family enzyme